MGSGYFHFGNSLFFIQLAFYDVLQILADRGCLHTKELRHCLIDFQRKNLIERFGSCAFCIIHQYGEALGIRRGRDYDNIEAKRHLDVIESIFLTNDSGLLCSVLQTTKISQRDCTKFYLMLPEMHPVWAKNHL